MRRTLTPDDGHGFGREPHLKEGVIGQGRVFQIKNGCGGVDQLLQAVQERLRQIGKGLRPGRRFGQV
ncbi:MAG: hypothetical protein Q7O12_07835 [Deltaproteobacteria bacterium]|nr:hypothetical protein [Deltaproteobacteria bacterium]